MKGCSSFLPSPHPPASSLSSSPTPSPLHVLRASLWNMAGRKESTIGVLSSDRCPCCTFSSHCEQALGRQPHKTWKNLTCVQNSSSCRSLKQTRTHAGTTSCRHITRPQTRFPFRLPGTCLKKVNTRSSHYWHIECNVGFCYTAVCETRKKAQSVILLQPLCRQGESMSCYRFNCMTDSFVSTRCYSMVC